MKIKSTLQQYGTGRGWFITCPKCNTKFVSNKKGVFRCNGMEYKDCPFCNDKPELTTRGFKMLCKLYSPICASNDEVQRYYNGDKQWTVWTFSGIKGEYHKKEEK
jgi:hypothetical protein